MLIRVGGPHAGPPTLRPVRRDDATQGELALIASDDDSKRAPPPRVPTVFARPLPVLPAGNACRVKHIDRDDVEDNLLEHRAWSTTLPDQIMPPEHPKHVVCAPAQCSALFSEHAPATRPTGYAIHRDAPPTQTIPGVGAVLGGARTVGPQTYANQTPRGAMLSAMASSAKESCAGQAPRQQPPVTCSPALTPAVALSWPL